MDCVIGIHMKFESVLLPREFIILLSVYTATATIPLDRFILRASRRILLLQESVRCLLCGIPAVRRTGKSIWFVLSESCQNLFSWLPFPESQEIRKYKKACQIVTDLTGLCKAVLYIAADLLRQSGLDIPLGVLTREELVGHILRIAQIDS